MGPSRYNNPEICQALQQAGALCTVEDAQQITAGCLIWLQDLTLAGKRGALGTQVLEQNSGAISKTLSILNQQI
jgi:3-deoxy-D-manno-octulosonic-acid transferase